LSIGLADDEKADQFQVVVATPQALQGRPRRRHGKLLVVQSYDWEKVRDTLEHWVRECDRLTWAETLNCLRARFAWEYEGMSTR
jgi:hypothetical protein